jgi:DNA-binding IclR family transcriptional regulator
MKLSSIEKSLQIIEVLSKNPRGLSLHELGHELSLPKSTIHHILSTLRSRDYIAQDPGTKRYLLGFRFLSIGNAILENIDVRRIARKYLNELHRKCNETIHLAILRDGKVVYIDKVGQPTGLQLATYIGFSTDPHAAAGGKILLSELSEREVLDIYRNRPLRVFGKNTITSIARLLEELENVRKQGYAIDNEEYYEGVRCVAAPIRAGGKILAALSITGSIFSMAMERINRQLIGLVTETARAISSEMQW